MAISIQRLGFLIIALAALVFVAGIVLSGIASQKCSAPDTVRQSGQLPQRQPSQSRNPWWWCDDYKRPQIASFLVQASGAVGTALAANFGAVLGIAQIRAVRTRRWLSLFRLHQWAGISEDPPSSKLQIVAAYFYFAALLAALVFLLVDLRDWGHETTREYTHEVVRALGTALIGMLAAVLAVALNVRTSDDSLMADRPST